MCYTSVVHPVEVKGLPVPLIPLADAYPELVRTRWATETNKDHGLDPSKISAGSKKTAWWMCDRGEDHEFPAKVQYLTSPRGYGCPYCSNQRTLAGFNDILTTDRALIEEWWDYSKNEDLLPTEIGRGYSGKAWWTCGKHSWSATVRNVVSGNRCPYCAGQWVIPGETDMLTTDTQRVMTLWDFEENEESPEKISRGSSSKKYQWNCGRHTWKASPAKVIAKGTGCPVCTNRRASVGDNTLGDLYPELVDLWDTDKNRDLTPYDLTPGADNNVYWTCVSGHGWRARVYNVALNGHRCKTCSAVGTSRFEKDVLSFIQGELSTDVDIQNNARVLGGLEADIWIPSLNTAIECNGVFYHSRYFGSTPEINGKKKMQYAHANGIKFYTVWEDSWKDRPDVVKSSLKHLLGVGGARVFARNTEVTGISKEEASMFMKDNHIQGYTHGSVRVGLKKKDDGSLVAAMILRRRSSGDLEVVRYATSSVVVGGHSKLVSHVERGYSYRNLVTFADLTVSSGDLYRATGWILDAEIPPDYMYTRGAAREHKFNYRKKRFRSDPSLKYVEGMTEAQLASLNNLHRVYDYGKLRFVKPHIITPEET